MQLKRLKYILKELPRKLFWKSLFRQVRGIFRLAKGRHQQAIEDFNWVIQGEMLLPTESWTYKNLGIAYARIENFDKSEECLIKALEYKERKNDGELFQWLGYVYLEKERYVDSLECFKKAYNFGQKGRTRKFVDIEYIKNNISTLKEILNKGS